MSQVFHVVRCFECHTFQVQQVKKVRRWSCRLCGEKQSLLKEFGRGSGADCRRHVQKLNAARGAAVEEQDARSLRTCEEAEPDPQPDQVSERMTHTPGSRWNKYLPTQEEERQEPVWTARDQALTDKEHQIWSDKQAARTPQEAAAGLRPPLAKPRPLFPPMFDSGDDFDVTLDL